MLEKLKKHKTKEMPMTTCNYQHCRRQNDELESHTFYADYGGQGFHLVCAWNERERRYTNEGWVVKVHRAINRQSRLEIAVTELFAKDEFTFGIKEGRGDLDASRDS